MEKTKANEWLEEDKLILLEGWARQGLFDKQIAENMGISIATFYNYKKQYHEIAKAIKKGKEVVDFQVENAMLKRALGYTITVEEEKVDKDGDIRKLKRDIHIPGDTTAQIFWLKNRMAKMWRDKVQVESNQEELNKVKELLSKIEEGVKDE